MVSCVNGLAYGAAFNLALATDLVVASENARFCQVFTRRGLIPDVGGAFFLPRIVGMQRAKELMLLAPVLTAADAHKLGIVNALEADAEQAHHRALELADQLCAMPSFAVQMTKRLVNRSSGLGLEDSLELEALTQAQVLHSHDAAAGMAAFLQPDISAARDND